MAKVSKVRRKTDSRRRRVTPYPLPSCSQKVVKDVLPNKRHEKASVKKDWKDATCSVCLEYPHNAVLLLCSSYHKGCRPYMCATSHRYSNCLEQYKKAYTKVTKIQSWQHWDGFMENPSLSSGAGHRNERMEVPELLCPLCRGQVKGWTVVEPARKYLNAKKRGCMKGDCLFVGSYRELRKHVRAKHPLARPRAVDPALKEKWKRLECERERDDVISTIISSTPGAVVLGDYVIEPYQEIYSNSDSDVDDYMDDTMLPRQVDEYLDLDLDDTMFTRRVDPRYLSFDLGQNSGIYSRSRYHRGYDSSDENSDFGRHRATAVGSAASHGRGLQRRMLVRRSRGWQQGAAHR